MRNSLPFKGRIVAGSVYVSRVRPLPFKAGLGWGWV